MYDAYVPPAGSLGNSRPSVAELRCVRNCEIGGAEERKLVWSRAARVPWKQISGGLGCDRTTAWRRWQFALTKIAARLNA